MKLDPEILATIDQAAANHTLKAEKARQAARLAQATSPRVMVLQRTARRHQKLADDWTRVLRTIATAEEPT